MVSSFMRTQWREVGKDVLKAGMLKWLSIPFSSGPCLSELPTVTRPSRVAPHSTAHSVTELDKAVVHVVSLVSFL